MTRVEVNVWLKSGRCWRQESRVEVWHFQIDVREAVLLLPPVYACMFQPWEYKKRR